MVFNRNHLSIAALSLLLALGAAGTIYALDCPAGGMEYDFLTLELLEVTVNGEIQEDLEYYDGLGFTLHHDSRTASFVARTDSHLAYSLNFRPGDIPAEVEAYLADEGGEQ